MQIKLAACRANSGMTQEEFSKALGVGLMTYNSWEKGKVEPPYSKVRKISELSGIPIDYIVTKSK